MKPIDDSPEVQARKVLYQSSKWRRFRLAYLKCEPWCVMCRADGKLIHASILDHVNGHGINWREHFWDTDGLQGLCPHHHAVKTKQELKPDIRRPWRE